MESRPLRFALAGLGVGFLLVVGGLAAAVFSERATADQLMAGVLCVGAGVFTMLWVLPDMLSYRGSPAGQEQPQGHGWMDGDARATTVSEHGDSGDIARPTATAKIIQLSEARRMIERG